MTADRNYLADSQNQTPETFKALAVLNVKQRGQAMQIADSFNFRNSTAVTLYAADTQLAVSEKSGPLLSMVRTSDSGIIGEMITGLLTESKKVNPEKLKTDTPKRKSWFKELAAFGKQALDEGKEFVILLESVDKNIERYAHNMQGKQSELVQLNHNLDDLFEAILIGLDLLMIHIAAGEFILSNMSDEMNRIQPLALSSGDPRQAQEVRDLSDLMNGFDKRVYNLRVSVIMGMQAAAEIRMLQSNNNLLIGKLQDIITQTIPAWRTQAGISLAIYKQKQVLTSVKDATDATNELMIKNAEMLRQGTVEIQQESERGIADVEALATVNQSLIATLEDVLQIQEKGAAARRSGEQKLGELTREMSTQLSKLKSNSSGTIVAS